MSVTSLTVTKVFQREQLTAWRTDYLIDRSRVRLPAGALHGNLGQLSLLPPGIGKLSTSLLAGAKAKQVCHLCRVAGNTV